MLNVKSREIHKNLRDLVMSYEGNDYFNSNKENILFEINHLELHGLDGYLFDLHRKKFKTEKNPSNSNISYLIGLTSLKPNGRVKTKGGTTPDIDTDFIDVRRTEVIEYLKQKYGADKVAKIGTFGLSKCKGLFKDLARIWELSFEESNAISKLLPDDPDASLVSCIDESDKDNFVPKLKELADSNETIKKIFEYGQHIEGSVRNVGIHASGIALTSVPVTEIVPLFESKGEAVTQYDGNTLEKLGIVKFDILGLKTLTVIANTLKLIKDKYGEEIDLYNLDLNDINVYKLFDAGDLLGIFQVEGNGIDGFAKSCKPRALEELSAIVALYRPGPMGMKDSQGRNALQLYLERIKNRDQKWEFSIPEFSHIFQDTYGLLVYQEQLMRLSREMCGFTDIEADELRKAVGKKDRELLLKQRDKFIDGAVIHTNQDRNVITALFDSMEEFARYCFNLSHSICYAYLSFQTAWLKTYYKKEYIASMISAEGDPDQKSLYIENARFSKIKVVPPDINRSDMDFTVGDDESILFGFNSVKNIGEKAAQKILNLRPFNSIGQFLIKAHHEKGINKKVIEALVYCGALDCFGYKKSAILAGFATFVFDYVNALKDPKTLEQDVMNAYLDKEDKYFDNSIPELSFLDVLEKEKELLGIYLSASPFKFIKKNTKYANASNFSVLPNGEGKAFNVLCRIDAKKNTITKAGQPMAYLDCIDENNKFESFVVFTDSFKKLEPKLKDKIYAVLKVSVRRGKKDTSKLSLIVNDVIDLTEELNENIKKIEFKNAIRSVSLVFETIPSMVRFKSIQSILSEYRKGQEDTCKVNIIIKINETSKVHIDTIKVSKIDVNFLRAFSRVKDVYLTRDNDE